MKLNVGQERCDVCGRSAGPQVKAVANRDVIMSCSIGGPSAQKHPLVGAEGGITRPHRLCDDRRLARLAGLQFEALAPVFYNWVGNRTDRGTDQGHHTSQRGTRRGDDLLRVIS